MTATAVMSSTVARAARALRPGMPPVPRTGGTCVRRVGATGSGSIRLVRPAHGAPAERSDRVVRAGAGGSDRAAGDEAGQRLSRAAGDVASELVVPVARDLHVAGV